MSAHDAETAASAAYGAGEQAYQLMRSGFS